MWGVEVEVGDRTSGNDTCVYDPRILAVGYMQCFWFVNSVKPLPLMVLLVSVCVCVI